MSKLVQSIKEAIRLSGLRDGMTISFHHHLRNGDYVINMVLEVIAELGIRDININASSIFDVHKPLIEHIKNGVVTGIETDYMGGAVGNAISHGIMDKPVIFRSHGGRPNDIERGASPIDVAFIAAPTADNMGNCSGKYGKSACGSLGYAFPDAMYAGKTVVITDNLVDYPLSDFSIPEFYIDYVVNVDKIGDPSGIVSGTTKVTRDPIGLQMAWNATQVIRNSGLLKEGMSFQTGAGGASLAVAMYLKELMLQEQITGSFALGGTTSYLVDLLEAGCFKSILDVQCFDLGAVESLRKNPAHREISATHYASPGRKSAVVDNLDVVILGATEIDVDFNVNVHTDSSGSIMGGSGGHSDAAAGSKLAIIIAPLSRARLSTVVDKVTCTSTPGHSIDCLVTQSGIAVNPKNQELLYQLKQAKMNVLSIEELYEQAKRLNGKPEPVAFGQKTVGKILYRDGNQIDSIRNIAH